MNSALCCLPPPSPPPHPATCVDIVSLGYHPLVHPTGSKKKTWQGTSDPVVYVEAFGQKFATEVVKNRLNAVFDETFVINLRNMDMDAFNEGWFR